MTAGSHDAGGERRASASTPTQSMTSAAPRPPAARRASRAVSPSAASVASRSAARGELERLLAPVDGDDATRG